MGEKNNYRKLDASVVEGGRGRGEKKNYRKFGARERVWEKRTTTENDKFSFLFSTPLVDRQKVIAQTFGNDLDVSYLGLAR